MIPITMMLRSVSKKNAPKGRVRQPGISLLEMAMVMIVVSVALLPVMQTLNGNRANDGSGPADRITGYKSKEALMANTLIEQALSGDYSQFNCNNSGVPMVFNPTTDFPASGTTKVFNRCTNNNYNQSMYFQWTMYSVPNLPAQNQYYRASLNVYNVASGGTPLLTLQTNFFRNQGAYSTGLNTTGIMLAMDTSGSMASAQVQNAGLKYPNGIASPFMFYRFNSALYNGTYNAPGGNTINFSPVNTTTLAPPYPGASRVILDPYDNTQLDMGLGQAINTTTAPYTPDFSDPDTSTPANEKFPYSRTNNVLLGQPKDPIWGEGILGTGNCGYNLAGIPSLTAWSNPPIGDPNIAYTFIPEARNDWFAFPGGYIYSRTAMNNLCRAKTNYNFDWLGTINTYMSRAEGARTGALSMLLTLESNPSVASTMQIGFIPWNSAPDNQHLIVPESPISVAGHTGLYFTKMRNKLLWVNRADPSNYNSNSPVRVGGSTNIYQALELSRTQLMAQPYGHRIIVLLTDGVPNPNSGSNSQSALVTYAKTVIGNSAPEDQQITLFTVNLISGDSNSLQQMATNTPGGQYFPATDLSQLKGVFVAISYSIQKIALLNTAKRYGISL